MKTSLPVVINSRMPYYRGMRVWGRVGQAADTMKAQAEQTTGLARTLTLALMVIAAALVVIAAGVWR